MGTPEEVVQGHDSFLFGNSRAQRILDRVWLGVAVVGGGPEAAPDQI